MLTRGIPTLAPLELRFPFEGDGLGKALPSHFEVWPSKWAQGPGILNT